MKTTESELEVPDVPSNSGRGCTSAARAAKGHILGFCTSFVLVDSAYLGSVLRNADTGG